MDTGSFAALNGVSLNSTETVYWVGFALREWKVRSGADFDINQLATTTANCETSGDGYNVVGVTTGSATSVCGDPDAAACHIPVTNIWGNKIEADICVVSDADTFEVVQSQIDSSNEDLVGILVHEFGHFLGLEHTTAKSIMKTDTFFSAAGRHLFGDDIAGIRAIYGSTGNQRKWRKWSGASRSIGSATSFGGTSNWQRTAGDVGGASFNSTQRYLLSTALNRAGSRQYFHRAEYPLAGSSTWSATSISTDSWTTAGIATNDQLGASARWVAFWPRKSNDADDVCQFAGGMSTNAFSSSYSSVTIDGCSLLPPSITHDPNSGRFVMVWKHFGGDFFSAGRLYAATSTNGTSWTSAQDLGIHTLDAPSIDCHQSTGCVLSYARASSKMPTVVTRKITVASSDGAISNGSWTQGRSGIQHTPTVGPYWLPDGGGNQFLLLAQYPSGVQRARGTGGLWIHDDDVNPPSQDIWTNEGIFLRHPPAYAGRRNATIGFILTAD